MKQRIKQYAKDSEQSLYTTLKELCHIPAPSGKEDARAIYCKSWLEAQGAQGVYIDEAKNVVFPINAEGSSELTVLVAHTDTVFLDEEPMPYYDDGVRVHCPGVADDTSNLTVLLHTAKFIIQNNIRPARGLLIVANSCEEGLGNLKGTRQLFSDYEGRIARFISVDAGLHTISTQCVGSHRYEVEVATAGGHSFQAFGNKNAIAVLADMISKIYAITPPKKEGHRVTYNVGIIEGGTSVNTIAQSAKMLCEYRSSDAECIDIMEAKFKEIFDEAQAESGVAVRITPVGKRPCERGVDSAALQALIDTCAKVYEEVNGFMPTCKSASTDCNIPLSLCIPAVCIGAVLGQGAHTREEWAEKASLIPGLEIVTGIAPEMCI